MRLVVIVHLNLFTINPFLLLQSFNPLKQNLMNLLPQKMPTLIEKAITDKINYNNYNCDVKY